MGREFPHEHERKDDTTFSHAANAQHDQSNETPGLNISSGQFGGTARRSMTSTFSQGLSDPLSVRNSLGTGNPLEGGLRSRMEGAFGADLGHVRVHTDAHASGLSQRFGASAFAVGNHIAFRQGTFRPGTLSGDGLIAHEVAHTLQQRGATVPAETGTYDRAESDSAAATRSAVGRLAGLPGAGKGSPIPLGPTGLSLQRCDGSRFDQPGPEPAIDTTSFCCTIRRIPRHGLPRFRPYLAISNHLKLRQFRSGILPSYRRYLSGLTARSQLMLPSSSHNDW
jgi:hypothetical protein